MEAVETPAAPAETLADYEQERGKPMPSRNHSAAQANLLFALAPYRNSFSFFPELTIEIDGKPYVPDLCIYPKIKVDWNSDELRLSAPPLTVVEIASPSQGYDAFEKKMLAYFKHGAKSYWFISPFTCVIAVFSSPAAKPKAYSSGEMIDEATGIKLNVDEVFV